MDAPALTLSPRTRGRRALRVEAEILGPISPADLALLDAPRASEPPKIARLHDRHHALARALASGMRPYEASAITGYDPSRISILQRDPSFQDLVEDYRVKNDAAQASFVERASLVAVTALSRLADRLEDDEDPMSDSTLIEVVKLTADRTGHAPVQKNLNLNVNQDLGARLRAASARLQSITVIEGEATDVPN